jgi:hypothetical protein
MISNIQQIEQNSISYVYKVPIILNNTELYGIYKWLILENYRLLTEAH